MRTVRDLALRRDGQSTYGERSFCLTSASGLKSDQAVLQTMITTNLDAPVGCHASMDTKLQTIHYNSPWDLDCREREVSARHSKYVHRLHRKGHRGRVEEP